MKAFAADVIIGLEAGVTNEITDLLVIADSMASTDYDILLGFDFMRFQDWTFRRDGSFSASW